jgi:hypothetical protein
VTYKLTPEDLVKAEHAARRFQATWWQGTSGTLAAWIILLLKERKQMAMTLEQNNAAVRQAVEARLAGAPIELPDALRGYTLTPAEPAEEATFDEPEPAVQMTPEQLDAAWAGVTQRQAEMQAKIREPQAAEPVTRRVVPAVAEPVAAGQPSAPVVHDGSDWVPAGSYRSLLKDLEKLRRSRGDTSALRPGSREFVAVLEELKALHLKKTMDYGVDDDALSNIRSSADIVNMPAWAGCVIRMSDKMHRLKAFFRRGKTEFDGVEDTLLDLACYAAIALVLYREQTCTKVQ